MSDFTDHQEYDPAELVDAFGGFPNAVTWAMLLA